ncbi:MAG: histidinol-phosphate transaminase [bacterium]|nr:histidinol-phosphate transaminase [bacterium]
MLKPYKAGKPIEELAREKNLDRIVKLASNENPLGPSPLAMEAMKAAVPQVHRYIDPSNYKLVNRLAEKYGKRPEQIICGHGTDALHGDILGAFTQTADEVLTSEGTFIGVYVNTRKHTRTLRMVPMNNWRYDLEAIAEAISPDTRVIYLANPNNPTGLYFTRDEFEKFMPRVPKDVLVLLDEAYDTYAAEFDDYPDGLTYDFENLIVTRTLSKIYGLGGMRVGFAVGPEYLIAELHKVRLPFEPNHLAQEAAIAALDDDVFLKLTIDTNRRNLKKMRQRFESLGIEQLPTSANFIMLLLPSEQCAADFFQECLNRGLILRHLSGFGIPNAVRINSGTDEETDFALDIIDIVYPAVIDKYKNSLVKSH